MKALKHNPKIANDTANSLLKDLRNKFKDSVLTISIDRISRETDSIHFNVEVKDEYCSGGWLNLTDRFTDTIVTFMNEKGFMPNFNNNKSIFWIYLS